MIPFASPVRLGLGLAALAVIAATIGVWRAGAAPGGGDPRCTAPAVAAARTAFRTAYAAGDFDGAAAALETTRTTCVQTLHALAPELAGEITNDLALADHRAGEDKDCLAVLEDYSPADRRPTRDFARLSPALRKAMQFNWKLCHPGCEGVYNDATCDSLRANEEAEGLVEGFRHRPCPLKAGASAVALPDGSCLVLLPAKKPFAIETADQEDPRDICPLPARLARVGGRTVATPLRTPDGSFLISLEHCCDEIDLSVDAGGRVAAEPHENPPEGCLFGHRTSVMQDIFRLQNGRLVMVRQLSTPWFDKP